MKVRIGTTFIQVGNLTEIQKIPLYAVLSPVSDTVVNTIVKSVSGTPTHSLVDYYDHNRTHEPPSVFWTMWKCIHQIMDSMTIYGIMDSTKGIRWVVTEDKQRSGKS